MQFSPTSFSDVTSPSSRRSCLRHCLRHTLSICISIVILTSLVDATPQMLEGPEIESSRAHLMPEKRPARLSYFRAPYSASRGRYDSYGSYGSYGYGQRSFGGYGKNDWWRKKAVNRYRMPWERLPITNCLRKFCTSDNDCCRHYSKCNTQANVCYDCWYGHPCDSNRDCCDRFPYCNPIFNTCGK